ncbi:MAG: N-acetylmuramoyl-L-alanine amidase, partial [Sutterella sp.]
AAGIETWRYENVGAKTKKLSDNVQTELIGATGAKNRGVKTTTTLYVLKHTVASAVLVECGFISNSGEAKQLFTEKYQDKLASAIVNGVYKALS